MTRAAPGRRALLGSGAALAIGGVIGAARPGKAAKTPPATRLDAQLIAMCADFAEVEAELRRIDGGARGVSEDECNDAVMDWHSLVRELASTPARTSDGIKAKAQAATVAITRYLANREGDGEPKEITLARSLARDTLALNSRTLPSGPTTGSRHERNRSPPPHGAIRRRRVAVRRPDREAILPVADPGAARNPPAETGRRAPAPLCRARGGLCRHRVDRQDAGRVPEAECTAALDLFHGLVDRIGELPARTADGIRAKALSLRLTLAHLVKVDTGQSVEEGGQPEDLLAWSLINDVLGRG